MGIFGLESKTQLKFLLPGDSVIVLTRPVSWFRRLLYEMARDQMLPCHSSSLTGNFLRLVIVLMISAK